MAILILIAFIVIRVTYLRDRKKVNKTATTKVGKFLEIGQFLAAMIVVCCVIGWIPNASVNKTYAQMQEKINTTQTEIAQLEENFSKEDSKMQNIKDFTTQYIDLKSELEEAEIYIKENKGFIERGLPTIKFFLYFGV